MRPARAVACSLNLDLAMRDDEPHAERWDYVLLLRLYGEATVGVEVHPALATEIEKMIGKKDWAARLLATECPDLAVARWFWVIPPDKVALIRPGSPAALRLAEAGIEFPRKTLTLE